MSFDEPVSVTDVENWLAFGAGAALLLVGASRRSAIGACIAASSAPLLYRGLTGRWPSAVDDHRESSSTRRALAAVRGKAGSLVASLFGREPSQTIREDLRHFKQLLEAGEIPRATPNA